MMGRQGDLWDDSALLNAFEDAISKYKIMHGKKSGDVSNNGELISSGGDDLVADVDDHQEATRQEGAVDKSNLPSSTVTEMGESSNPALVEEKQSVDPHVPEPSAEVAQDVQKSYSYLQDAQDYNQLLNQLYELEQKKQQIIGQLHQYGSWNYQSYGSGSGSGSTFQEHPLPVCQASNPTTFCTCCPYAGQCFAAPCTSLPSCFLGGSCVGKSCADVCEVKNFQKPSPQVDSNIVETAMGAAERAIASMREKVSGDSNSTEGNIEKEKHSTERAVVLSTSSETDLTVVLNAWYSAGFYTGKKNSLVRGTCLAIFFNDRRNLFKR